MSTAMSSKRTLVRKPITFKMQNYGWFAFFMVGVLFFLAGLHTQSTVLLIPGFVGLVGGILHYNAILWGKIFSSKHYKMNTSMSRIQKF